MNREAEEVMRTAKEFDALSCSQQVELVTKMIQDAIEQEDFKIARATLIPLALICNRHSLRASDKGAWGCLHPHHCRTFGEDMREGHLTLRVPFFVGRGRPRRPLCLNSAG